jgi:hypothetical protein
MRISNGLGPPLVLSNDLEWRAQGNVDILVVVRQSGHASGILQNVSRFADYRCSSMKSWASHCRMLTLLDGRMALKSVGIVTQ